MVEDTYYIIYDDTLTTHVSDVDPPVEEIDFIERNSLDLDGVDGGYRLDQTRTGLERIPYRS